MTTRLLLSLSKILFCGTVGAVMLCLLPWKLAIVAFLFGCAFVFWRGAQTMLIVFIVLIQPAFAATYYISPTGSVANPGTVLSPWPSYKHAATNSAYGDTIIALPGVYEKVQQVTSVGGQYCSIYVSGRTFQASNDITNHFGFWVYGDSNTFSGLKFDSNAGHSQITLARGGDYNVVTNCSFANLLVSSDAGVDMQAPTSTSPDPSNAPRGTMVLNCVFDGLTNGTYINVNGIGPLIERNTLANGTACDAFRLWGSNVVIRLNVITNMHGSDGSFGNHPDIIQSFGDNRLWSVSNIFERNLIINCPKPGQFSDFSMKSYNDSADPALIAETNYNRWSLTLQSNVFVYSSLQASSQLPNLHYLHNTFLGCTNSTSSTFFYLGFGDPWFWDDYRGTSHGFQCIGNIFAEGLDSVPYTITITSPQKGPMTTAIAGGGGRTGGGLVGLKWSNPDMITQGTYSNLSGTITSGTVMHVNGADIASVDVTNFVGGVFNLELDLTGGSGGYTTSEIYSIFNTNGLAFRINTTTFPTGEIQSSALYQQMPSVVLTTNYNFFSTEGGGAISDMLETNSINGGNPRFVNAESPLGPDGIFYTADDGLRLLSTSPVIGAGPNGTDLGAYDYATNPVPVRNLRIFGKATFNGTCGIGGGTVNPPTDPRSVITAQIVSIMAANSVPGLGIAVMRGGVIDWADGFGVLNLTTQIATDTDSVFQAASISKTIAALVTLKMVDDGDLFLDTAVNGQLTTVDIPGANGALVTLRELLSHTAGCNVSGYDGYTVGSAIPTLSQVLLGQAPANSVAVTSDLPLDVYEYSGGGYEFAQSLAIDVSAQTFEALANSLVFAPIGLTRTTFTNPPPVWLTNNAASGHNNGIVINGKWRVFPEMAAAGLWTTPTELGKMFLNIRTSYSGGSGVLTQATAQEMMTDPTGDDYYGLGVALWVSGSNYYFRHTGHNYGYRSGAICFLSNGDGVVIMTNMDEGGVVNAVYNACANVYGWPLNRLY